jgi:pentose-5-phosphate-3-epimerase
MLTPPGQPGHIADLDRLTTVRMLAGLAPVGVDGGVTEASLPVVAAAGAAYAVAGRALFG